MQINEPARICKSCGSSVIENYCGQCGVPYQVKRISMAGLLHDIFHFFTHLDKGIGYTIKMLIKAPGHMQRQYIEGDRARHQKPFSMFFICATIAALSRYWIYQILMKYYNAGNISEQTFFDKYMVLFIIAFLPFLAFLIFVFFYKSGYNYAEIGVFVLYSAAFFLLVASCISLLKFIWIELDTAHVEFPFLLVYNTITFINFFNKQPRWIVIIKSIVITTGFFLLLQVTEDFFIEKFVK